MNAIVTIALFATIAAYVSAQEFENDVEYQKGSHVPFLIPYRMLPLSRRHAIKSKFGDAIPSLHFLRSIRRSRELFGKRSGFVEEKRRSRELFGKRSVKSEEEIPFNSAEVLALATLLTERPRRARGTELFGR
ncbi:unnamed protein product [Bursaphelenchus okinawaensis]|uniref:Uncharacterized protein n=1 Tax=Bursaphelenchus okinawaensis TaxID=465554 RepID=A0A811KXT4_9BILA|nr:unnamed protein product [Bursaphelenchus okinawaensis]CAG9113437.1 unnamed protein product [Bursaphelenchus okinawaensis]